MTNLDLLDRTLDLSSLLHNKDVIFPPAPERMGIDDINGILEIIDKSSPPSADNKITYNNQEYPNWITKNGTRDVADTIITEEFIMNLFEGKKTINEIYDILFIKLPMTEFILENYDWYLTYIHKRLQMIKIKKLLKPETMGIDDIKKILKIVDDSSSIPSDDCNTFNKIRYNNQEYPNYITENKYIYVADTILSEEFIMNLFEGKKTIKEIYDILFIKLPMTEFILENYGRHLTNIHSSCERIMWK